MNHAPPSVMMNGSSSLPIKGRALAKLRTREKVLAAARAMFVAHGYEAATIRGIAAAAGMSTGAVFASFVDKAELFDEIMLADFHAVYDDMYAALNVAAPLGDRLVGMFAVGYAFCMEQLQLLRTTIAVSWTRSREGEMRNRLAIQPIAKMTAEALTDAARRGEIAADAPVELLTQMLWEVYLAGYRAAIYDGKSLEDLSDKLRAKVNILLAGARA